MNFLYSFVTILIIFLSLNVFLCLHLIHLCMSLFVVFDCAAGIFKEIFEEQTLFSSNEMLEVIALIIIRSLFYLFIC